MGLNTRAVKADLCVVGGGIAGTFAAISAARQGVKVALVNERPVLGGNASSEIRMWICGAQQNGYRESGLNEELNIKNYYYNPDKNHYLFDLTLLGLVRAEKNIELILNATIHAAKTDGDTITSVTAYQMTTQTEITVTAKYFADCSGDSILAPLTGAAFAIGRESKAETGESMMYYGGAGDDKTMGNSLLIQARYVGKPVKFTAPDWAEKVPAAKLKSKGTCITSPWENFWYLELGGNDDTIRDSEKLNARLMALCLGVWDTIKNSGEFDADEYDLGFFGFLPAKRESRRMIGDYVMTACDIVAGGKFDDIVAYGGWSLDDHNPDGFFGTESNHAIPLERAYGIPYRCLYSKNIENLFFAGRNISMTHLAVSSARVMGTCGTLGEAVGAAASVALRHGVTPRAAGEFIGEIRDILLENDCFLPYISREISLSTRTATLDCARVENLEAIRNGFDRNLPGEDNAARVSNNSPVIYDFGGEERYIERVKLTFDSDFDRETLGDIPYPEKIHSMRCNVTPDSPTLFVPKTLAKSFSVVGEKLSGEKVALYETDLNLSRNVLVPVRAAFRKITLTIRSNHGDTAVTPVFAFDVR